MIGKRSFGVLLVSVFALSIVSGCCVYVESADKALKDIQERVPKLYQRFTTQPSANPTERQMRLTEDESEIAAIRAQFSNARQDEATLQPSYCQDVAIAIGKAQQIFEAALKNHTRHSQDQNQAKKAWNQDELNQELDQFNTVLKDVLTAVEAPKSK